MSDFNPDDYKIKKNLDNQEEKKKDIVENVEIEGGRYERDENEYEHLNRILYGKNYESNKEVKKENQNNDSIKQKDSDEIIKFPKLINDESENKTISTENRTSFYQNKNEYPPNSFINNQEENNHNPYLTKQSIEGTDALLTRRVVAYVLDSVMITIIRVLLTFIFALVNFTGQVSVYDEGKTIKAIIVSLIFLAFVFYLPIFLFLVLKPYLNQGLTFGRKLAGIRIVTVDGRKPSLFQLTIREFLCESAIISKLFLIAFLIGLGFLYKKNPRQTLFDLITKTKLVNMD